MYITRSLPMLWYAPLATLLAGGLIYLLERPADDMVRIAHHLDNALMSCPAEESAMVTDRCDLMDDFYDRELYNQLVEHVYASFQATAYITVPLLYLALASLFCSALLVIDILL